MIATVLVMCFPIAMAFAAANDLFTMRIPNQISLILIAGFVALAAYMRLPLDGWMMHAAIGAGVLAIGFVLFSFSLLGGGDAKLLAAGALWMGPQFGLDFVVGTTVFGGVLAVAIYGYRKLIPINAEILPTWAVELHRDGTGIPYGIAIAASGMVVYPHTQWFLALMS